MCIIEPDIDRYGTDARNAALGDFLEAEAYCTRGLSTSRDGLADYIGDNNWTRFTQEHYSAPGEPLDAVGGGPRSEEEAAQERAEQVFSEIRQRAAILGDLYPFDIEYERVRWTGDGAEAYLALLALTLCHAYQLDSEADPKRVFEDTVARTLSETGLLSLNFATVGRNAANLGLAVEEGAAALELAATPERAAYRIRAQDAGVDTLCHLWLKDERAGRWVFIGQVTCAQSDDWLGKLSEPKPRQWERMLGMDVSPQRFLAVPHHVQDKALQFLSQNGNGIVVDRLRLTQFVSDLSEPEHAMIEALDRAEVTTD